MYKMKYQKINIDEKIEVILLRYVISIKIKHLIFEFWYLCLTKKNDIYIKYNE
jgi:hypothetical protein